MAFTKAVYISLAVAVFGVLDFIFGVVAENKKPPPMGNEIEGNGVIICKYLSDPTIALWVLSCISLPEAAALGLLAIYFPYKGRSVPSRALFQSTSSKVFLVIAVGVTVLADVMMAWAAVTQCLHRDRNVRRNIEIGCGTAMTGLFGGAVFLGLDAALVWLICQTLTIKARSDYLDYDDSKVVTNDNDNIDVYNL